MLRAVGGVIARRASAHVQQGTIRAGIGASLNRFKSTVAEVPKDEQVGVAEPVDTAAPTSELAAPKRGEPGSTTYAGWTRFDCELEANSSNPVLSLELAGHPSNHAR